jgi:hypothetical protein
VQEIVVFSVFSTGFCDGFSSGTFPDFSRRILDVEVHGHTQNVDREEPVASVWGVQRFELRAGRDGKKSISGFGGRLWWPRAFLGRRTRVVGGNVLERRRVDRSGRAGQFGLGSAAF